MPVDPFFLERLALLSGIPDYRTALATPYLKARLDRHASAPVSWTEPEGVAWQSVELRGRHGPFEIRIYRPEGPAGVGLLWMHGGGWSQGTLDMPEGHVVAAELAARAKAIVVSVGYHLATDVLKYPGPLDDVLSAWEWFVGERERFGLREGIAIGGASAGGSLALGAALRIRDEALPLPVSMLLAYPLVHFPVPALPSKDAAVLHALPPLIRFEADRIADLQSYYVGRLSGLPVYAAPGHGDLRGLPPARIIVAEFDDLRPSGELLARQLGECGNRVEVRLARGMIHGHLNWHPGHHLPEVGASLDFFATFARGENPAHAPLSDVG